MLIALTHSNKIAGPKFAIDKQLIWKTPKLLIINKPSQTSKSATVEQYTKNE